MVVVASVTVTFTIQLLFHKMHCIFPDYPKCCKYVI